MEKIGVTKKIDKLGRTVIPKEFRELYGIKDKIELITLKEGILVRNPQYKLSKINTAENTTED